MREVFSLELAVVGIASDFHRSDLVYGRDQFVKKSKEKVKPSGIEVYVEKEVIFLFAISFISLLESAFVICDVVQVIII